MDASGVKSSGAKILAHSDLRGASAPGAAISLANLSEDMENESGAIQQAPSTSDTLLESEELLTEADKTILLLYKRIAFLQEKEEEKLLQCKTLVQDIRVAAKCQPNIKKEVSSGLGELEALLSDVLAARHAWKKAKQELHKTVGVHTPGKKGAVSGYRKRGRDNDESPDNSATPTVKKKKNGAESGSEWNAAQCRGTSRKDKMQAKPLAEGSNRKKVDQVAENKLRSRRKENTRKYKERKIRTRLPVVAIKPGEGRTYAEILKSVNAIQTPEGTSARLGQPRKTAKGEVVVSLVGDAESKSTLTEALKNAVNGLGEIRRLEPPRVTVRIMDLNSGYVENQVKEAVKRALPSSQDDPRITFSRPNQREQVIAFVNLAARDAESLVRAKHLQIGPFRCRIRRCETVLRCFRCLGFGHPARSCEGPNREGHCFKCGSSNHKMKDCQKKDAECMACSDMNVEEQYRQHIPGTGLCTAFRNALERARN